MIAIKGIKMPKNCVECDHMYLRHSLGCELILNGCANCGRHPNCPLVEITTCKDCKHYRRIELNSCDEVIATCKKHTDRNYQYVSPNYFCADAERRE